MQSLGGNAVVLPATEEGRNLSGGMVRFWCGDRPLSMHLRACMMKWRTPPRSATVRMKPHSAW